MSWSKMWDRDVPSYHHDELRRQLASVDAWPKSELELWLSGAPQLAILRAQRAASEVILYSSGRATFVHSVLVPNEDLRASSKDDLLTWGGNPYGMISYVYGGGRDDVWIERSFDTGRVWGRARQLVFIRKLPDYAADEGRTEILQEFEQVEGLHKLIEERAFCKLNDQGDLEHIVSYTIKNDFDSITLVSCRWSELERYMAVTDQTLVQMFDFTRVRRGSMANWSVDRSKTHKREKRLFYAEEIHDDSSWTRGVQLLPARRSSKEVFDEFRRYPSSRKPSDFTDFLAYDWRNRKLRKIGTRPGATTNYFDAKNNKKPYELSPAFLEQRCCQNTERTRTNTAFRANT